jgi:hypothetical protein
LPSVKAFCVFCDIRYRSAVRWLSPILFLPVLFLLGVVTHLQADSTSLAPTGRVVKVLPLLMDTNGAVALSPSLFDRDAYQFYLRAHTNEITGIRFDVDCDAKHAEGLKLKVRLELRGAGPTGLPTEKVMEQTVTPRIFHHWTSLTLAGPDYKNFGVLAAWRATLWNGGQLLGEQKSFLWSPP